MKIKPEVSPHLAHSIFDPVELRGYLVGARTVEWGGSMQRDTIVRLMMWEIGKPLAECPVEFDRTVEHTGDMGGVLQGDCAWASPLRRLDPLVWRTSDSVRIGGRGVSAAVASALARLGKRCMKILGGTDE